jgi:spore germination cell wall hydrolase CwlJ-like protein
MLKRLLILALSIIPFQAVAKDALSEKRCMVSAIYYEANTQSDVGKRAVMDVILNRVKATGKSVCQVIAQPGQFSWFDKKPILKYNVEMKDLLKRMEGVGVVLMNENVKWFHHVIVKPKWAKKMSCMRLEEHMFCYERS